MERIRPLDGFEMMLLGMTISLEDSFQEETASSWTAGYLREKLHMVQELYDVFRLAVLPDDKGHLFWYFQKGGDDDDDDVPIELIPWQSHIPDKEELPFSAFALGKLLYKIRVSICADAVRLEVAVTHSLCDGRTIDNFLGIIRLAFCGATKEELVAAFPPEHCAFTNESFGKEANFTISDEEWSKTPERLKGMPTCDIYPELKEKPKAIINETLTFPWGPVFNYCTAHKDTAALSGILIAAMERGHRAAGHVSSAEPFFANVHVDTRSTKYATSQMHSRLLFCGANTSIARLGAPKPNASIAEDITRCTAAARAAAKDICPVSMMVRIAHCIDRETLSFAMPTDIPDMTKCALCTGSSIGRYNCTNPRLRIWMQSAGSCTTPVYGYHSKDLLKLTLVYPDCMPDAYIRVLKEEICRVISFVSAEISKE